MLFTLFRYCLIPVVLYGLVIITAGIDAYTTNAIQNPPGCVGVASGRLLVVLDAVIV